MKAVVLKKIGSKDVLKISEVPDPEPKENEVKIKIETIGLNYAEVLSRKGLYGWAPKRPYILGMEAYGTISAIGSKVKGRKVGDKVIVGAQCGTYAEYICVPDYHALPGFKNFTPEENAAFAVNFLTAYIALFKLAKVQKGDRVLIQSGAGGVGSAAIKLAKAAGCEVFTTAGSDEKIKLVKKFGAKYAFNYNTQDFEKEINEITKGAGVDAVLELVGGEVFKKSLRLLSPFGRLVTAGFTSLALKKWNPVSWIKTYLAIPKADILSLMKKSLTISSTHVGYLLERRELIEPVYLELLKFTAKHKLKPHVGKVFDFKDVALAQEYMETRASSGKVVMKVNF
jgi:NADPH2:quinone reductase